MTATAPRRLLIVAPNWLGDAVMALPAIADVRRALPEATIIVSARRAIAPLFALVSDCNGVGSGFPGSERDFRPQNQADTRKTAPDPGFDAALLLPNSFQSAWTAYRARIPERWGYRTDWRGTLLTRAVAAPSRVHQIEYYQHLVRGLGFATTASAPRLTVTPAIRAHAADLLEKSGWNGRSLIAALAPGAAYGGAKRWPPKSFAALAGDLAADGVQSVIIGSAADRDVVDTVVAAFPRSSGPAPIDLAGRTDLATLAGVLTHCRTLVTNDSGAMHVAAAAGVPVTAVFGPTDETATRPIGGEHRVITHDVFCRPCMLRECPIDHRCMRRIGVATVVDAARRTL